MQVIKNEMVTMWDCDDTLVMWGDKENPNAMHFVDPHDGTKHLLVPHKKHVKLLKDFKARGYVVVLWSGGGWQWAETVAKTLGIEDYVDFVMTKPSKYIDDLQAVEILGSRIYLKND